MSNWIAIIGIFLGFLILLALAGCTYTDNSKEYYVFDTGSLNNNNNVETIEQPRGGNTVNPNTDLALTPAP